MSLLSSFSYLICHTCFDIKSILYIILNSL
ncbi:MAG TPA: hypothetical protein [Caudoviricetes sp.]|nr:MAG TPA: hypothetical protein [Caudoviricetes sp.]